jgi:hypothetical protein
MTLPRKIEVYSNETRRQNKSPTSHRVVGLVIFNRLNPQTLVGNSTNLCFQSMKGIDSSQNERDILQVCENGYGFQGTATRGVEGS